MSKRGWVMSSHQEGKPPENCRATWLGSYTGTAPASDHSWGSLSKYKSDFTLLAQSKLFIDSLLPTEQSPNVLLKQSWQLGHLYHLVSHMLESDLATPWT